MTTLHTTPSTPLRVLRDLNTTPIHGLERIVRGWPSPHGDIHAEAMDTDQRVRAMHISAAGEITVLPYATDPRLPSLHDELNGPAQAAEASPGQSSLHPSSLGPASPGLASYGPASLGPSSLGPAELSIAGQASGGCLDHSEHEQARLVVHRYGKRAVTLSATHARKHLRAGKSRDLARSWEAMSALCANAGIATPRITDIDDHSVAFSRAPGHTLHDLGDAGMDGWHAFARHWPALATQESPLAAYTPRDEARTLNTWLAHATRHGALPHASDISRCVDTTTAQLVDDSHKSAAHTWVTTHRDLHDKQLLWDGQTLTLLDMDTAVRAEAALDIANLRAHIDLRITQGTLGAHLRGPLMDLTASLATTLGVTHTRLHTYECASRLRLACVYAFRPAAASWLPQWVDDTLKRCTPTTITQPWPSHGA